MQSHTVHGDAYYRCRFPAEYALANRVGHPLNVNLREDAIIGHVDRWLAREFAPHRLTETLRDLAAAAGRAETAQESDNDEESARKIAEEPRSGSPARPSRRYHARIKPRQVVGGLISEYRRAA
jgi:hypothetical protein